MTTRKPRPAISRDGVSTAFNVIEAALGNAESTVALFSAMIDHDIENDPACVGAIERHLVADMAALRAAFDKAHADTIRPAKGGTQ